MIRYTIEFICDIPYNFDGKSGVSRKAVLSGVDDNGKYCSLEVMKVAKDTTLSAFSSGYGLLYDRYGRLAGFQSAADFGGGGGK